MNYFKHNNYRQAGRVWSLFTELANAERYYADKDSSLAFSHTVDIVNAAFSGSISLDSESLKAFNLSAYEYGCYKNDLIEKHASASKELFIVDDYSNDSDKEKRVGFGDISVRKLSIKDDYLDRVMDSDAFDSSLAMLLGLREEICIKHGVDIVEALKASLRGVKKAITVIQELSEKDNKLKDLIYTLCSTGDSNKLYNKLSCVA